MGVLKSPLKPALKSRSRTRDRSPETTVSSLLLAQSGIQGPRTNRASAGASATLPGLFRHATFPSLSPPEQPPSSAAVPLQPQQPAAQPAEHPPGPPLAKPHQSLFTGSPSGVELLQPGLLGPHHQPQLQETARQDQNLRANSEPRFQLPQRDSMSDQESQVGQIIRAGTRVQHWNGTDSGPSGHVTPSLRRAHDESLEAERQYWAASQRLQQAKQREEALQFEQDMQLLSNRGDSDNSSSRSSVRHSGSEEGHLHQNVGASHRQSTSTSTQPSLRRGGNERQTPQHESLAFSKTTRPLLLTLRKETLPPPADTPETTRGQDAHKDSKGNAEAQDREVQCDGESSLFAWLERSRRSRSRGGPSHYHPSSPKIKVKSEEREASYSAALKEERDSGGRPPYEDYDVLIEIPSSIGSESGSGTNASPQRRWRSPTPLPPKAGLHFSQGSTKPSPPPPPAAAGTSRDTRHCSRGNPPRIPPRNSPRTRPSRSRVPRPRPYASPPNPRQPAMHSQRLTQTSPQGPRLFSRRFSDRLGSYPAVIFYTHIEHVENYYQRPHEHRMQPDEELPSAEAEQSMEHDDHDAEAQLRGGSPRL
ncbi:unnamed protein product [Mortierella alpina]